MQAEQILAALLADRSLPAAAHQHAGIELAELELNVFCNARACHRLAKPLEQSPEFAERAQLASLVARLYDRDESDTEITRIAKRFSKTFLDISNQGPIHRASDPGRGTAQGRGRPRKKRPRIGLLSPMFTAGPLYYLSFEVWKKIAKTHDLIIFNRGKKSDWATEAFRAIAKDWIDCPEQPGLTLASTIASQELQVLFELGGWMDTEGLKAVSLRPAPAIYKWVGGQAMTTGLSVFDGYLSDQWQSPKGSEGLFTEPLLRLSGGYVQYTPPAFFPKPISKKESGVAALIGNPVKVTQKTIDLLIAAGRKSGPSAPKIKELRLIDRRYGHPRVLARIESLLERFKGDITVIAPDAHEAFLQSVAPVQWVIDTTPYSAGLTAREALTLGAKLLTAHPEPALFAGRHGIAAQAAATHNAALKPAALADQFLKLLARHE
jgi:predicted O-linked N-acetylglucosamine transferase (SPINDLY family)